MKNFRRRKTLKKWQNWVRNGMGRGDESNNIVSPTNLALVFFLISKCILSSLTNHDTTQITEISKDSQLFKKKIMLTKISIFSLLLFMIEWYMFILTMVALILQKLKYSRLKGDWNTHKRIELEQNFECFFT